MPEVRDRTKIRELLSQDRPWAVYALGDLDPRMFDKTRWYQHGNAVCLLFGGFDAPVLFSIGEGEDLQAAQDEALLQTGKAYLSVKPAAFRLISETCSVQDDELMLRMVLMNHRPTITPTVVPASVTRLTLRDINALRALYADGQETREAPDFFSDAMVENGLFYGVYDGGGTLVAAAGTHLVSPVERVAAIGCVYTHRRYRQRGLSQLVTKAVINELAENDIELIALNVKKSNASAISVYSKLGFKQHCEFYEGLAMPLREIAAKGN